MNGAYITLNGGTNATPIYLVVNQPNIAGITRSSGHIISEGQYNFVRWDCGTSTGGYVYPFGIGATAADYIPFTFDKSSVVSSSVDVSTWATNNQNMPHPGISDVAAVCCMKGNGDSLTSAIDRFWDIRTAATTTANITFSYKYTENATTAVPTDVFKAQHWNGATWDPQVSTGGTAGVTSGIGTVGPCLGQTTFSPWVLTRSTFLLPVDLIKFSSQCNNNNVDVKWTTASEQNNDFFTVERSPDAMTYMPIGIVSGSGNSSIIKNYSFTDTDPLSGTSYYRLSQTDFNGMSQILSSASTSSCNGAGGVNVVIGPNPVNDGTIWVQVNGAENKNVRISVTDVLGREFFVKDITDKSGSYLFNTTLQVASGIYIVSAATSEKVFSKKIVVIK